ncbi:MAG: transglutaminase family protein [Pseudomonadota bacterium]
MRLNLVKITLCSLLVLFLCQHSAWAAGKSGTVTYTITPAVLEQSKSLKVWLPYPLSNQDQTISNVKISGNYSESGVYKDAKSGAVFLYAGWPELKDKPLLTLSFHVDSAFKKGPALKSSSEHIPADIAAKYLVEDPWTPVSFFKDTAAKLIKGKKTVLAKAQAVYDWTVENTYRDNAVKACGLGQASRTITECKGGGKCADISSVFVALARAAGVPARDVFGLRTASPKDGEITGDFHCWAEIYLPGHGWVMVDPADVRKMMLVHKLELKDSDTKKWREFFWNGDDLFRIVLNKESRGVRLTPAQQGEPIGYFMYPFAQVDGQTLDYFDAKAFSFKVELKLD